MAMDRDEFMLALEDSYSAYYTIHPNEGLTDLPLVFVGDYSSRDVQYFFVKSNKIWGNETNEYAYIFSAPSFDTALADRCIDFALADALPKVRPHSEHQYTNVKVILVADSFDEVTRRAVQKRRFNKSYKFSLHGYSMLLTAAVDLSEEQAYPNAAGRSLVNYFRKLFDARNA